MKYLLLILAFAAGCSYAEVLPQDSPERKQLIAMGYELVKEDAGDRFTVAEVGGTKIAFTKNEDGLIVSRFFNIERKLNKDDEAELLRILNKFNEKFVYQFSMGKQMLAANLYIHGPHEAKTFARIVRLMDKVNNVFDTDPRFFRLVNN